jgi:ferrous-iron efflux pump FieF
MAEGENIQQINPRYALLSSAWTVGTVAILIAIKTLAYLHSHSAAVLASLTDSLTDAGISVMMLLALRYSLRPADKSHRHGHGKMEGIAALFQAGCLMGAGLFLLFESMHRFAEPRAVENHFWGMGAAGISILLTLILVAIQNYCLKRAPSLVVEADQAHYKTDVLLNASVVLALYASYKGAPVWVDTACAIFVALYYGFIAVRIGASASDMLMDRELPEAVRTRIKETIKRHPDIMGFHDLRTRKSGMVLHISFDVEIDPEFSLKHAHEIVRALEQDIISDFPYAEVIIHKDPYGDTHDSRHKEGTLH